MFNTKIVRASLENYRRVIAVSDIHESGGLLKTLLANVEFSKEDALVLVGDYIERGVHDPKSLEYVMNLSQKPNVYCLLGNWEIYMINFFMEETPPRGSVDYVLNKPEGLARSWARSAGFLEVTVQNINQMRKAVLQHCKNEILWMRNLPYMLDSKDFIFVHGGVSTGSDPYDISYQKACKNDDFLLNGVHKSSKHVVVGHMPIYNLAETESSISPVIVKDRRIIPIDGGMNVKAACQLNALIINNERAGSDRLTYAFVDYYQKIKVRQSYMPINGAFIKDGWPPVKVDILKKEEHFSYIRVHGKTAEGYIKNEYIKDAQDGERYIATNSRLLPVKAGEEVSLIDNSCSGYAFVKNWLGVTGWVPKSCL